ncbi:MAG: thiol oxidoreductase-like protein [Deltaproteobacteria bacterium]|nr:thiol oxidoreductase-like protein [Deltaproteobacteria bacterium]
MFTRLLRLLFARIHLLQARRGAAVKRLTVSGAALLTLFLWSSAGHSQLIDRTQQPNVANEGIAKTLSEENGAGRGDILTPNSSLFIINRDTFRAIRRGRQLFQRKFTQAEGQGPRLDDGTGDLSANLDRGAGLTDSCAGCHGRPRGSAGFGGDVATRPDSRDAPHLFGLGLKEILADEITTDLRAIRARAISQASSWCHTVTLPLMSKGIQYGAITAHRDGSLDTSQVQGVNPDLRVRPFFAHGGKISIREFIVGAFQAEMGLQAVDPDLAIAHAGGRITTPAGMVLDGSLDQLEAPPTDDSAADLDGDGVTNEVPAALVDYLEFYLLNYFKPATYEQSHHTDRGRRMFREMKCTTCHISDLEILHDRRVADVQTVFDPVNGVFNGLFATATPLHDTMNDSSGFPALQPPRLESFLVKNVFTDFKRHNLGPNFYERNYDGTVRTDFLTTPLWGVGSTAPYGHDGRSINLTEVILRHGGEAQESAQAFANLSDSKQRDLLDFLNSLVLFPPDDTASNLNPANPNTPGFPQFGHGSIKLSVLFRDPTDPE